MSPKESTAIGQLLSLLESRYAIRVLWALKDAISANGNYDEMFSSNFDIEDDIRGRNHLNSHQHPQLLDLPGLNL